MLVNCLRRPAFVLLSTIDAASTEAPSSRYAHAQARQAPQPEAASRAVVEKGSDFSALCDAAKMRPVIASIGAGNMARALLSGFVRSGTIDGGALHVCDPFAPALKAIAASIDAAHTSTDTRSTVSAAGDGIVLLAVKPDTFASVADSCREELAGAKLIISVLAGTSIDTIRNQITASPVIARVMPNTPALVGAGASVFALSSNAGDEHAAIVDSLFSTVGTCDRLACAKQIDAVCGLSGSGPAYVFTVIDALSDGGVRAGLPRALATKLAAQTVMGAAQMVVQLKEHPAVLKDGVCSPGGTTIAGVHELESRAVRDAFISAVQVATQRAVELGKE